MKIDPSKRSRQRAERRPLHKRLTLRRAWQQRLVYGSGLALVGASLGWLGGLASPWQLGLTVLGLVAGCFWRFRRTNERSERWAFGWIETQAGLTYQTAVELGEEGASGLGDVVRARAARISTLALPTFQPWYLPLLLVTLLVVALPHLALPGLRSPLAGLAPALHPLQPQVSGANPAAEAVSPVNRATAPEDLARSETAPRDTLDSASPSDDAGRSFDTATDADSGEAETLGEQAALERFLDGTQDPGTPTASDTASETPTGSSSSESQASQSRDGAGNDEKPGGEGGQSDGQSAAADSEGGDQRPAEAESSGKNPPGQAQDNQVQQASGSSAQPQEVPPDEKIRNTGRTAQESERNNEQTSTEGVDMLQMRNSASQEKDNLNQMVRDGESSERAGTGAGEDIESSRERLGGNTGPAERLEGERGKGPSALARGATLEQGQVPDALPGGNNAQSYRRAAEEVIREGRIPIEYQNIVRDYFR